MHQTLTVVTPSTCEPLTRDEAKEWLKVPIDVADDDAIVDALVSASRRVVEDRCRRFFYQTSCQLRLDGCPDSTGVIRVPYAPLKAVASITSYGTTDGATVLTTDNYHVDTYSEPGRIALSDAGAWPSDLRPVDSVVVACTVGYSSSTGSGTKGVPADARPMLAAVQLVLAHLYENRQAVVIGNAASIATEVPMGVDYLLAPLLQPEVEG